MVLEDDEVALEPHTHPEKASSTLPDSKAVHHSTSAFEPLIHHSNSFDSLDNFCPGERRPSSPQHDLPSADLLSAPIGGRSFGSRSTRGSESGSSVDGNGESGLKKEFTFGVASVASRLTGPSNTCGKGDMNQDEDQDWTAQLERKRIREFYEQEGWLCSPRVSRAIVDMRKRVM
jgi:hypothetical protein